MTGTVEIDDRERRLVESILLERYGRIVPIQLADVELKLAPGDPHLLTCPTLYWEERGAAFAIAKVAEGRYRTMFFYLADLEQEQYGTGRPDYDNLADCVIEVLRAQADHEKERHGVVSGKTARDLEAIGERDLDGAGPRGSQT